MSRLFTSSRAFDIKRIPGFATVAMMVFVILYAPIVTLVVYSFNAADSMANLNGFSFRWYVAALHDDAVQSAALRSLMIASFAATVATVAATMAALATTRTAPFRGMTLIYAIINQPLMVPEVVTAVALLIFFALIKVATGYTGLAYLFAAHAAFCIPFAYLPIRARLESMDLSLERAAADLYATPWRSFRFVTLPLLWPGILAGAMLAFVISLDDVVITEFIKSAGQDTLPTFMLGQLRRMITPEVDAIATTLLLAGIVFVTIFFLLNRRRS